MEKVITYKNNNNHQSAGKEKEIRIGSYNPFEIAFAGYSGSGKTTIITALIKNLKKNFRIGYIKHDAHKFEMDREGKDTWKALEQGAGGIMIGGNDRYAAIHKSILDKYDTHQPFLNYDMVFIEGFKYSPLPKFLVLDQDDEIKEEFLQGKFKNLIGLVGPFEKKPSWVSGNVPYYNRDNVGGIESHILDYFKKHLGTPPLYGLVLTGGKSTRMKKDKATLQYRGKSHALYTYELLQPFCEKVFISSRKDQKPLVENGDVPCIYDTFLECGPAGGILSAMVQYPEATWLVVACDLPYLDWATIEYLVAQRNPFKFATTYQSSQNEFPEPLCTIYEPKCRHRMLQFLGLGVVCPRKFLINSETAILQLKNNHALDNVNYPDEFKKALTQLS